jgi:hypothetical protein
MTNNDDAHNYLNKQIAETDLAYEGITQDALDDIVAIIRYGIDAPGPLHYGFYQLHFAINAYTNAVGFHRPLRLPATTAQRIIEGGHWYMRNDADDDADMVETAKLIYLASIYHNRNH